MGGLRFNHLFGLLGLVLVASGSLFSLSAQSQVTLQDRAYLNLHEVSELFNLQAVWTTPEKELLLSGQSSRVEFTVESRSIQVNGMRVFMGEPILLHEGELYVCRVDFETTLRPILMPQSRVPSWPVKTVVIDPGHGGRDDGTRSDSLGLREKHLTLVLSQRLKRELESRGYRVILTRTDDSYVSLVERSAIAVRAGADLFVSIHLNAVGNPAVEGTETYVLTSPTHRSTGQQNAAASDAVIHPGNQLDHWNTLFGFLVQRQLLRDLGTFDRGLKRARFGVLRGLECPAVLVEAGYLSNPKEAALLASREYQDRLVHSLARAIDRYRDATENISASAR